MYHSESKAETGLAHCSVKITNFQFFCGPSVPAVRMTLPLCIGFLVPVSSPFHLSFLNFSLLIFDFYSVESRSF